MKKTTATTALAATIGLSAWTMTAAFAIAPAPAPAETPSAPAAEVAPAPSVDGMGQGGDGTGPEEIVVPDWARDLENNVSCADAVGTPYQDNVLKPGLPPILDADGDGIMCESNGDDDAAFTGVIHEVPLVTEPVVPAPAPAAEAPAAPAPAAETPAAEAPAAAAPAAEGSQVEEVPVGGADTGASEAQGRTALFAGGAAVAALAGAGLLVRRVRQH